MVSALQIKKLTPIYLTLDAIMAKSLGINEKIKYEFDTLMNLSEAQQAQAVFNRAQADQIYLNAGVVTEQELRQQVYNTDVYPDIDPDDMSQLEADKEAMNQALAQQMAAQKNNPDQNDPNNQTVKGSAQTEGLANA